MNPDLRRAATVRAVCSARVAVLCALLLVPTGLRAQEVPGVQVPSTPSTPPPPATPADSAIRAAIEAARAELAALEAEWHAEATERNSRIAERTAEVRELAEAEIRLRREFATLGEEIYAADERRIEADQEKARRELGLEALASELRSQAFDLQERFRISLSVTQDPQFLAPLAAAIETRGDFEEQLDGLLHVFARVLDAAESAGLLSTEVRLTASGGEIREASVLRFGLLGGYYSTPAESGFLLLPTEAGEKPEGRSIGLAPEQQAAIAALIADPASGGTIPTDVTGGAGLATLAAGDSRLEWFEKGGVFMWPLLVAAIIAVGMILERAIVLAIRTRGISAQIRRTIGLIQAGRTEEALHYTTAIRGPAATVLSAALVHSDRDRSVIEDAVQEALLHIQPIFNGRLALISLCAAIAPLIGLLGTVTGMILTFNQVTLFGTSDPRYMAGGISEALITTEGGLYLAIPCLLARGLLGAFADRALGKLESGAMSVVLAILKARGEEPLIDGTAKGDGSAETPRAPAPSEPERAPNAKGGAHRGPGTGAGRSAHERRDARGTAPRGVRGSPSRSVPEEEAADLAALDLDDVGTATGEPAGRG
jgi:biopolymer transport protein ExbB